MAERIAINDSDVVKPGDVLELEYRWPQNILGQSVLIALVESRMPEKNPDYDYRGYTINGQKITFRVVVKDPQAELGPVQNEAAVPVAAIVTAIAVIGGGLFLWLSLDNIYKIVDTPGGQVLASGSGLFLAAAAVGIIYFVLTGKKVKT